MDGKLQSPPKKCVIEFQGFRNNWNTFIIKELVFLDVSRNVANYFLFKPPFSFGLLNSKSARTNRWLSTNLHHITWEEGFTEYDELDNIMYHYCQQFDEMYTTGDEKVKWIEMYFRGKVRNIQLKEAAGLSGLCIGVKDYRHKNSNCALSRAYRVSSVVSSVKQV